MDMLPWHGNRRHPSKLDVCLAEPMRAAATCLGLLTIEDMPAALVWAIEHPPSGVRVIDVPEIRRLGKEAG